jgi:hypothetical protein
MEGIKGFEKNKPAFIKGKLGENKFDGAPLSYTDHMLVASCRTDDGIYIVKI